MENRGGEVGMARQTKIRIVGDPKLAMKVALCINEHFVIERQQMYNRTPYRYAKTPGVTYYIVVKKEKEDFKKESFRSAKKGDTSNEGEA